MPVHEDPAGMLRRERLQNARRAVRRTVVAEKDLEEAPVLRVERSEHRREDRFPVEDGNRDREERFGNLVHPRFTSGLIQ